MLKNYRKYLLLIVVAALLMNLTMVVAFADDDDDEDGSRSMGSGKYSEKAGDNDGEDNGGKGSKSMVSNAKWKEECGACHLAYPPRFLSAESWRAMMSGLDKHFGSDASLDPAVATEIGDFLEKNASTRQRKSSNGKEPALRISETRWFVSEHRKVADRIWKDPKVKSPSNCAACHTQAESGSYRERDIRMPK